MPVSEVLTFLTLLSEKDHVPAEASLTSLFQIKFSKTVVRAPSEAASLTFEVNLDAGVESLSSFALLHKVSVHFKIDRAHAMLQLILKVVAKVISCVKVVEIKSWHQTLNYKFNNV